MKKIFLKLILIILYLTPLGYIISLYPLTNGKTTPGIYIVFGDHVPFEVKVKQDVTLHDRTTWLTTGAFLLFQAYILLQTELSTITPFSIYLWFASLYGTVNIITSLFPSFHWNTRYKYFPISLLEILVLTFLFASVGIPKILNNYGFLRPISPNDFFTNYIY